jgi:hypothetical protein
MKAFLQWKTKIIFSLLLGLFLFSCSDQKQTSSENSKNKELVDSLAIEKREKSIEVKELNSELDSLKKFRDSLKTNSK